MVYALDLCKNQAFIMYGAIGDEKQRWIKMTARSLLEIECRWSFQEKPMALQY